MTPKSDEFQAMQRRQRGRAYAGAILVAGAALAAALVLLAPLTKERTALMWSASLITVAAWTSAALCMFVCRWLPAIEQGPSAALRLAERGIAFPLSGAFTLMPLSWGLLGQLERENFPVELFLLALGAPIVTVAVLGYKAGHRFVHLARGMIDGRDPRPIKDLLVASAAACVPGVFFFLAPPFITFIGGVIPVFLAYRWARFTAQREALATM